jgi:hypothetical protein
MSSQLSKQYKNTVRKIPDFSLPKLLLSTIGLAVLRMENPDQTIGEASIDFVNYAGSSRPLSLNVCLQPPLGISRCGVVHFRRLYVCLFRTTWHKSFKCMHTLLVKTRPKCICRSPNHITKTGNHMPRNRKCRLR